MTARSRALLIGFSGPLVQTVGLIWEGAHILLVHYHHPLSARHIIFEPAVLLVVVGFALSLLCVPLALEVATTQTDEPEVATPGPIGPAGNPTAPWSKG